ncbi:MAG: hypothetical protein JWR30_3567, partial [Conexibacter sp.]|nr:hypothetical protein [Conexibacter sp.]
ELAVLVVAGFAATITRYVALKTWVFATARHQRPIPPELPRARAEAASNA